MLNYAWKHKFPERRSAFTYWEEECPSRIDLGKDKYGGPFTVEEVENVKSVFNLLPLIICIAGILFLNGTSMNYHLRTREIIPFYFSLVRDVVVISWLPIYHLLIYPFFYNRVPSMLRRIGVGFCVIVSSHLFDSVMYFAFTDHYILDYRNATVKSDSDVLPLSEWLVLSSHVVRDVSIVIVCSIVVEFCMAQTPCQVRSLVSTVIMSECVTFIGVYNVLDHYICIQWVLYMVRCVTVIVFFIIFVLVSKWYKLRKRDDVIPYYIFAEDQFESNYRQQSNWLKSHEDFESSASSTESK